LIRCARCGLEASKYDRERNQCSRCDALEGLVKNLIHSPRVPVADWPDSDLSKVRVLIDFMRDHVTQPRVSLAEVEIFEQWWAARRAADERNPS